MVTPFHHGGGGVRALIRWGNGMHGVGGCGASVRKKKENAEENVEMGFNSE